MVVLQLDVICFNLTKISPGLVIEEGLAVGGL